MSYIETIGPMAALGGREVILAALVEAFPGVKFGVSDDAIAVFIRYTTNLPGATLKADVQQALACWFGAVTLFKIPTLIRRESADGCNWH